MLISEAFESFELDELLSEGRSQKTIDAYHVTCRSFMSAIGYDIDTALISYTHIIQWKRAMHAKENSGAHMALLLRQMRRILTYLRSHGFATLDPSEIKIPRFTYKKTDWLTIEEVGRFLSAIDNARDRALFGAMFSSGARISELLSLDCDSIRYGEATIVGKGGVVGTLHFDKNALSLIDNYTSTRKDDNPALFISRQNRRISVQQCIVLAHQYAQKAGITKRVSTHVLRHSFGTNLELNGLDIHGISLQMRHKKLETTKIYLHGSELRKEKDYGEYHTPVPL